MEHRDFTKEEIVELTEMSSRFYELYHGTGLCGLSEYVHVSIGEVDKIAKMFNLEVEVTDNVETDSGTFYNRFVCVNGVKFTEQYEVK